MIETKADDTVKLKRTILLLLTLLGLWLCSSAQGEAYLSSISFDMTGKLKKTEQSALFLKTPGAKSGKEFRKKDVCKVLGHSGKYYRVSFRGKQGYILKESLDLQGKERSSSLAEEHLSSLKIRNLVPKIHRAHTLDLTGAIRTKKKIDSLFFYVWDVRRQRVEASLLVPVSPAANQVEISRIKKQLELPSITGGRKLLVVQGGRDGKQTVLYRGLYAIRGACREPAHITAKCKVSAKNVLNTDLKKGWTAASANAALTVDIPQAVKASLLTLEWQKPPASFTVSLYGSKNKLLSRETYQTGFFADSVPLNRNVRKIRITASKGSTLITLRVYPARYATHAVQRWKSIPGKIDLMVIAAHQDDELLFLGGTIPYACGKNRKTAVMYLGNGGRERYREALDGLWTAGLRYHPIFMGWNDAKVQSLSAAYNIWKKDNGGKDPRISIVRSLRRHRPDVVVTQDLKGEYGHNQHRLTAQLVIDAVKLAKDPAFDPASVSDYGIWEVKKLYVHLYKKNQITMNWNQSAQEPFTAMMLAKEAFDKHRSQLGGFAIESWGKLYDNRKFGLYCTSVGPDVKKNDFFENIPQPGKTGKE